MAAHITAIEADLRFKLAKGGIRHVPHRLEDGGDLKNISAKGVVPALELDDGQILTKGVAILAYLADQREAMVAPPWASFDRDRLHGWLTSNSSELHKTLNPWLFHPEPRQPIAVADTSFTIHVDLLALALIVTVAVIVNLQPRSSSCTASRVQGSVV